MRVYLSDFDGRGGFGHSHFDAAEVLTGVVAQSPLPGLFVDDEIPGVGIFDQGVEGVIAFGNVEAADVQVGVSVEGGGGVGSGAPDGVVGIAGDESAIAEDLAASGRRGRSI